VATLGLVEFFLFVLSSYYEEMDKEKYNVFGDVHFALFYTAILYAFQSLLLAFVSNRVSEFNWLKTEMLQLNHYVEIREEFDHVQNQLDQLMEEAWSSDTPFYAALMAHLRCRSLRQRYRQLLLQIRFHELRVHFLEAYQLPLRLKVSDYLLKSQQAVMLQLVQVSLVA